MRCSVSRRGNTELAQAARQLHMYGPLILMLNRVQASLCFPAWPPAQAAYPPVTLTPCAVSFILRVVRCSNTTPSSSSRAAICWLTADCLIPAGRAARKGSPLRRRAQKGGNGVELVIHFVILLINAIGFGDISEKNNRSHCVCHPFRRNTMNKTQQHRVALVAGASGIVGNQLVKTLFACNQERSLA